MDNTIIWKSKIMDWKSTKTDNRTEIAQLLMTQKVVI